MIEQQLSEAWARGARSKVCAGCGRSSRAGVVVRGHHVIRQQTIRSVARSVARESGEPVRDVERRLLWDDRNRLPLCDACHERHHLGGRKMSLRLVLAKATKAFQFARELGPEALAALERDYTA